MESTMLTINFERCRQDSLWGEQNHDDFRWLAILTEELGETAQEMMEGRPSGVRHELVSVIAVAIAWFEAIGRRDGT